MQSLTLTNCNSSTRGIKYLKVPFSYILDPNLSNNAAMILSLFRFRNQLSLDNHELHKGTLKDHYYNKKGGYVFIRYMMKELLNVFRGTGKKAIRNAINQLDKTNYINIDKPKHSWKRKNEYHIRKKAYDTYYYAMSPKGTLQDPQREPARINNTPITNTYTKNTDTKSVDTQPQAKPAKPSTKSNLDKKLEIVKLKLANTKYKYRHKYHLQHMKQKQDSKAIDKMANSTLHKIHLPKVVKAIKTWSFDNPNNFHHYCHLMYAGKHFAAYDFKHQRGMDQGDYKFLIWGLQFEMNDAYKTNDFAKQVSDVITYTNQLSKQGKIKTSVDHYMRGWFKRIFTKYAKYYNNTTNPIQIRLHKVEPSIPLDLNLTGNKD